MAYVYKWMPSPIGNLKLIASDVGLAAILWESDDRYTRHFVPLAEAPDHPVLLETQRQLGEYFQGKRTSFDIPFDFAGTAFQKRVWAALLTIPFGETRSYAEIARQTGSPKAARAVGQAANRNPIAVIAPCHRVVGASGELTGFAGGLKAKECLLAIEQGTHQPISSPMARPSRSSRPVARPSGDRGLRPRRTELELMEPGSGPAARRWQHPTDVESAFSKGNLQ